MRPAANPATVGSTGRGNALFVPVEIETRGMSAQAPATRRFVPSPPSTTIAPTPTSRMVAAAVIVSAGPCVIGWSTNVSSGQPAAELLSAMAARPELMPERSTMASTRLTPPAARPAITRFKWFNLSWVVTAPPLATNRLMSRADAGLAMIPTVADVVTARTPPR